MLEHTWWEGLRDTYFVYNHNRAPRMVGQVFKWAAHGKGDTAILFKLTIYSDDKVLFLCYHVKPGKTQNQTIN